MLKKLFNNGVKFVMKSLPVIMTAMLVVHASSTASFINGQPIPPQTLKKYRKF